MILRALEPEDLQALYQLENDSAMQACTSKPGFFSREVLRHYIHSQAGQDAFEVGQLRLAICDEDNAQELKGTVDLFDISATDRRAEVGIAVLPQYRRQGVALGALSLLHDFAYTHLGLHQVYALTTAANAPSCALFRSAGYMHTATLKSWFCKGQKYANALVFQKNLAKS